ncbi:cytochrome c-type biogenesis protein [Nitratireductor luteus]|uniref:cytochrome c-type biogenesis protein n=1 Tax=Nitratireductor luteus TaxID=2976980 RepID=UPI0022404121|nr:cytochrome c-type biogenesis protein [Nitratireductor luteus]
MTIRRFVLIAIAALLFAAGPQVAGAVQPDEMLSDPVLEQRARDLSAGLRCMVCQNQSIDDSDAELARDLRVLVRERLAAGDSDAEVIEYVVSRYGEFVLLKPRVSPRNALLWATPVLILLAGVIVLALGVSRRRKKRAAPLTPEEEAALKGILNERD